MDTSGVTVRDKMATAARRIGRLKRIDRGAVLLITFGGIAVVIAVFGILLFIAMEAIPLFRSASLEPAGDVPIVSAIDPAHSEAFRAVGVDEYQRYLFTVEPTGVVAFFALDSGARAREVPVPGRGTAVVTASSRSTLGNNVAAGLSDGRVALMQVRFTPVYEGAILKDLTTEVRDRGIATVDPAGRPVRQVAYLEQDDEKFVAALVGDSEVAFWQATGEEPGRATLLRVDGAHRITHVRLGRNGALLAGTDRGAVYHWVVSPELRLTDVSRLGDSAVTALEWMLGGISWVAGTADGGLSGWFSATVTADGAEAMVQARRFESTGTPVVAMSLSSRERSFAALGRDGSLVLWHLTSERVLLERPASGPVNAVVITPKADGLLLLGGGRLRSFALYNPHPETSLKTLFGKVWYEGYRGPEYVWQSTGATDDFEPKLSLVPLIFGTIKGTVYAMMFAIPLAVLAALYTSQFADAGLRAKIKPTVEIMAALPSVVIGFLAGLYLASMVERNLVAVFLAIPLMPLFGTLGVFAWRLLPRRITGGLRAGAELALIVPLLIVAGWVSMLLAPTAEQWVFAGDARLWLQNTMGLTYDQRNCLVVGIAMGFAVIPIIFTISEDAFSSVPPSLTAASLALGASRWQTAVRIVLPTASPGIFSAVMVGFGRAVGETMIVLMATGNTPVMEWSIFNGIRTLSANIAVEIPEAPYASTLYRTLFLAAALLFAMTFVVNTVAEIIRQRLRERYRVA
jgi:phosphate transport system permease protein